MHAHAPNPPSLTDAIEPHKIIRSPLPWLSRCHLRKRRFARKTNHASRPGPRRSLVASLRKRRFSLLPYPYPRHDVGGSKESPGCGVQPHRSVSAFWEKCIGSLSAGGFLYLELINYPNQFFVFFSFEPFTDVLQGISRSASIVIAYLIRNRGMSYDNAFALVRHERACVKPNSGFVQALREWEAAWRRPVVGRRFTT